MSFTLVSSADGTPLEGVRILARESEDLPYRELGFTEADGTCRVEIPFFRYEPGAYLRFEDSEAAMAAKDTLLSDLRDREVIVKLTPSK